MCLKMIPFVCHIEKNIVCLHVCVSGNDFVFMVIMMDSDGNN